MSKPSKHEIDLAIASITGQPAPEATIHPDAMDNAKLLQGGLAGLAMRAKAEPMALLLRVQDVDIPTDLDGNYEDYFIITTPSGARIRVTVTPEP